MRAMPFSTSCVRRRFCGLAHALSLLPATRKRVYLFHRQLICRGIFSQLILDIFCYRSCVLPYGIDII